MSFVEYLFPVLISLVVAEGCFFVFYRAMLQRSQKLHLDRSETRFLANRRESFIQNLSTALGDIMDDLNHSEAVKMFLSGWFHHCCFEDIRRLNVEDFVARNFFNNFPHRLDQEERNLVTEYTDQLEKLLGKQFPPGRNSSLRPMVAAEDAVQAVYHPLLWYIVCFVLDRLARLHLYVRGFTHKKAGGIRYWHRKASMPSSSVHPVVFLHGIGIGLFPYVWFLDRINQRDLIVVEFPWVSMRLTEVPDPMRLALDIEVALQDNGFEEACFVVHSYGSFVLGYINCFAKDIVNSAVLLDPPALLLALPDVCSNFLHLRPINKPHILSSFRPELDLSQTRSWIQEFKFRLRHVILYWFSRELGNAVTLSRHLWWYHANIFAEDLPSVTTILLSAEDAIIPVREISAYIKRYKEKSPSNTLNTIWVEEAMHGGFLVSSNTQRQILDCIAKHH